MSLAATTQETLDLMKASLAKNVTIATGLTAYDLQAPAKNLYPIITPLRNSLPRVQRQYPGDAARWRTISADHRLRLTTRWAGCPKASASASMSYAATPMVAPYVTLGEEDTVTFEAEAAAQGFEDINSTATLRLLQKTMRKEETRCSAATPRSRWARRRRRRSRPRARARRCRPRPIRSSSSRSTFEGYRNSSVSGGVATSKTITGNDGKTYTLNGGSSNRSANATQAVTLGQTLSATVSRRQRRGRLCLVRRHRGLGDAAGDHHDQQRDVRRAAATGQQPASAITADSSRNPELAFDGLLTSASIPPTAPMCRRSPTGVAGTGTFLTASGRGSVVEIDNMLLAMWNNYRISPTVLYVNAQEQKNITNKCLTSASGPLLRYNVQADGDNGRPYGDHRLGVVRWYYNPFSVDGGFDIPVKVHPDLPPGTILAFCERLPVWYQSNEVPNVAEVLTRRDYYRVDWPLRTRRREYGVYAEEVLAVYAPFGVGMITNIGNG